MTPGPPPTPTETLRLRGSWRANKRRAEPRPDSGAPTCPAWLKGKARAEWKRLCPQLQAMGVLCKIDRNALMRYCHMSACWRAAEEWLAEHGETYPVKKVVRGKDGRDKVVGIGMRAYPQVKIAHDLADQLLRLEQQFGLTPSARTRIAVDKHEVKDGKARFFERQQTG